MTNLEHEKHLQTLIRNTETRFLSYKGMLERFHKDFQLMESVGEDLKWYRSLIRDLKNADEILLKKLQTELRNHREGLNPGFCYPF